MFSKIFPNKILTDKGSAMIEALVAMSLLAISGSALMGASLATTIQIERAEQDALSTQIAMEHLEELALTPPETYFDDSDTDETVEVGGKYYNRSLDVTVNTDRSRTFAVTIEPVNMRYGGSVTIENTLAMRGTR